MNFYSSEFLSGDPSVLRFQSKPGSYPELLSELRKKVSYPDNHNPSDISVGLASRRAVLEPQNWFKRPKANPLSGNQYCPVFDRLPFDTEYSPDYYDGSNYRYFWILLAEIVDASLAGVKSLRNEVKVKDKTGRIFPIFFYPDDDSGPFNYTNLRQGSTLSAFCPTAHAFMDGNVGLRMEQLDMLKVLHMPLDAVIRCSELVHMCSIFRCWHCKSDAKRPLKRCGGCGYARYCGVECQTADFARHTLECSGQNVRKIARLVYFAYGSAVKQQAKDDLYVLHPFDLYTRAK